MNKTVRKATAAALGALIAAAASTALAQDAAPAPTQGQSYDHGDPAQRQARMQAHRQEKEQALRAALQLRPDQEAAFQAFEQEAMPQRKMDDHHDRTAEAATMTTPQRLDVMLSRMEQRTAMARQRVEATKQFYAALTPQQQRAFDALMDLREHGHGFGGHRMHGGEGAHGGPEGAGD